MRGAGQAPGIYSTHPLIVKYSGGYPWCLSQHPDLTYRIPSMNHDCQNGHATLIHETETVIAGNNGEKPDPEHQSPCQPAKFEDERRCSERPASEDGSFTSPIDPMDWDGPDDPENPHNWSTWKLAYHTMIPALFGFTV